MSSRADTSQPRTDAATAADTTQRRPKHTLESIPLNTLIFYLKKDEVINDLFSPEMRNQLELKAVREKKRVTKNLIKEWLTEQNAPLREQFDSFVRQSPAGQDAYERYVQSYMRITDPANKEKSLRSRRAVSEARKGFLGCIATKVEPKQFQYCAENYDQDPNYARVGQRGLIPKPLGKIARERAGIAPYTDRPMSTLAYLPAGLRRYVLDHEDDYFDYLREREDEIRFLQSVRRNALKAMRSGQQQVVLDLSSRGPRVMPGVRENMSGVDLSLDLQSETDDDDLPIDSSRKRKK